MSWKGKVLTSETYSSIVDEIKAIAAGTAHAIRAAEFLEDFRQSLIPKDYTFTAPGDDAPVKVPHGFPRAPLFVAIKGFAPKIVGEGDVYGVTIEITKVDDTEITLQIYSADQVKVTLTAMLGTKYV